jgi:type IV pilus assembly protein PilC
MPKFDYIAIDVHGLETTGLVESADSERAIRSLKARGLYPTSLRSAEGSRGGRGGMGDGSRGSPVESWTEIRLPFVAPVSAKKQAIFTRQLATLLRAGLPLLRGLEVLIRQERSPVLRRTIAALADDIRSGATLSDALARHPRVFDELYLGMVRAGEAGGVLDVVLDRLAHFAEKSLRLRGRVRAALVYPVIVLAVAGLILVGLLVFVVPRFQQIFADLLKGAPLPPLTQAVLTVSEVVRTHYLAALLAFGAVWIGFRLFRQTRAGGRLIDGWKINSPLFGELLLKSIVARFSRTLGTLLASGVPILSAMNIARDTCGNRRVGDAVAFAHDRVKEGAPLARPLESARIFPPMVIGLIEVGEHTGQLPEMLNKIAEIYDEEVDQAVAGLGSLLEPVLIVILASVVGIIVLALFLPIIRIVQFLT